MTPKEKAQELFDRYYQLVSYPTPNWRNIVKQSSVIAVDEILNNSINYNAYDVVSENDIWVDDNYWTEVKKEINEL